MRALTVVGPSNSGKSTLIAALSTLDGGQGKSLATTGGTSVSTFAYMGDDWALFDVPGGPEAAPQIGPALAASDAALLCLPAEADAAVLCAPYLQILEASGVPSFIFVNGMDQPSDRVSDIIAALQPYCAHGIVLRQVPLRDGETITGAVDLISERAWQYREGERSKLVELPPAMQARETAARAELLESLADFDDHLLEEIIEDQRPPTDELYDVATRAVQHHDLLPVLLGSAKHSNGLTRLMKTLRHEVPQVDALRARLGLGDDVVAAGCLADTLKHIGKAVLVRALSDGVAPGNRLAGDGIGGLVGLDARTQIAGLAPGQVGLAIKSDHLALGTLMRAEDAEPLPGWAAPHPPALKRVVTPVNERDENKLPGALARLAETDPGLTVSQTAGSGNLVIGVHGPQHERRIVGALADTFGIAVTCSAAPPALRETIRRPAEIHHRHRKQSGGAGQFADVVLELSPAAPGEGFAFAETVKGGAVPRNYIPAVEAGVREALAEGPGGHPVVDVRAVLKDGKAHSVDSSDFAFRTAGRNAAREALQEAGTHVLQPILRVQIHAPGCFSGDVVQIVSGLKGQLQGIENHPELTGWDVVNALLPMDAEEPLTQALGSSARGTAWVGSALDHYEPVR